MIRYLSAALAEDAMQRLTNEQQMIERGTKAWAGMPDATAWAEERRGNVPAPTCQESLQVEPVAWLKVCEARGMVKGGEVFAARIRARGSI